MKKKFYLFAAAAVMLMTACSSDDATSDVTPSQTPMAVGFDTYLSNTTRAVGGQTGVMTTSTLQSEGFGVFAFQTNDTYPAGGTGKTPNFMYNQKVTYGSSVWSYSPLKYWPNNTTQDMHGGSGHATITTPDDYVSFFAYAPYVANGDIGTPGITDFTANNDTGDPKVTYIVATKPSESVDLLWGVTPTAWTYTDVANNNWNPGGAQNGLPLKNMLKPSVDTRMKFLFQHALSRLGINVIAAVDQEAAGGELNDQTKIVIESVTISETTSPRTLATSGQLNLNNTTANVALWDRTLPTAPAALSFIINASNELENSLLWETDAATSWAKEGVLTSKEKPLIDGGYLMLIPTADATAAELTVNIVYKVITKDTALDGDYSTVTNNITKVVNLDFDNGNAYTLKLILGLTSVKLDAEVKPWAVQGATDVDLPQNYE